MTTPPLIISAKDPRATALKIVPPLGQRTLHRIKGEFFLWNGRHYVATPDEAIRSKVWGFLATTYTQDAKGVVAPFRPTSDAVNNVVDALRGLTYIERDVPSFIVDGSNWPAPRMLLPCANGVIDLTSRELLNLTPNLFVTGSLPFAYDPRAPKPAIWLAFLNQLWPNDPESIECLAEWYGYCLTCKTEQQKALLLVGPRRSGKGTIGRTLTALLGQDHVAAPTLGSLFDTWGLQPLIGKKLALVSDARVPARADAAAAITEKLLTVTGEDPQSIPRKFLSAWEGRLHARFMLLSNDIPRLADASGALSSRFLLLRLRQSFLGREDVALEKKLEPELPGILNWGLDGLERLTRRGRFNEPASGNQMRQTLEDLASPMSAFVRDACVIGPEHRVLKASLFLAWKRWCDLKGHNPRDAATFGRDLRAAFSTVDEIRGQNGTKRLEFYSGIGLQDAHVDDDRTPTAPPGRAPPRFN